MSQWERELCDEMNLKPKCIRNTRWFAIGNTKIYKTQDKWFEISTQSHKRRRNVEENLRKNEDEKWKKCWKKKAKSMKKYLTFIMKLQTNCTLQGRSLMELLKYSRARIMTNLYVFVCLIHLNKMSNVRASQPMHYMQGLGWKIVNIM